MKQILIPIFLLALINICYSQPKMQATIKSGNTPNTIDVCLKSSVSFSQRDDAMTFALAIPATSSSSPAMGPKGTTINRMGMVPVIQGLQPNFLINKLGCTKRELVISKQTINRTLHHIYIFIFGGTADSKHSWVAGEEQLVFSIQFNGCTSDCNLRDALLVNLPAGGAEGSAYWYFQSNILGDITNYEAPFYANAQTAAANNGGSKDGSALSTIGFDPVVSLQKQSISFAATPNGCEVNISFQAPKETNAAYYAVERSEDNNNFIEISRITPDNKNLKESYNLVDNTAAEGIKFYRLRFENGEGNNINSISKQVIVDCKKTTNDVLIYPTITNGLVNVKLPVGYENSVIRLMNSIGEQIANNESRGLYRAMDLKKFSSGAYMIQVVKDDRITNSVKVILQQ